MREPFLADLADLHARCGPWNAVFFTGDLVQSGTSAQFREMQVQVLDPLWARLAELGSGAAVLIAVPGNHDLFRPNAAEDNPAIDTLLDPDQFQRIAAKFWDQPAGAYRRVIEHAFAPWQEWWKAAPHRPSTQSSALPGDLAVTIEVGGRRIGLMGLNTAFLQLGAGDYHGKLVWDPHQVHALCPEGVDRWGADHDLCLLLSHQGPDWLTLEAREFGESEIAPAGRFAAHLFGHMHETRISYLRHGGDPRAVRQCQGCSVFGMEHHGEPPRLQRAHGYTAGQIRFGDRDAELRLWPRITTKGTGRWRYVPDQEHAVLQDDQGTAPETLHLPKPAPVPPDPERDAEPAADLAPSASRPAASHSTLPARRPFFGRATELARVAACLAPDHRGWGIAIDGPGGIGKTALALEASYRAPAEQYPLKLWITAQGRALHPDGERRLADQQVHDFDAMLAELGRALAREDIPRSDPAGRAELVRHALAGQRALLVFDNLETLNQAERRRVFDLMERLPEGCRAILTSRRRTGGAWAGQWLRLDRLDRAGADALIAELGLRWPPAGRLKADERDRLYAETGGNPLLLTWTLGQLGLDRGRCRTLDAAIERLQQAQAGNDPLEFIFGDLVETFTADETAVLAALVHFAEPALPEWLLPLTTLSRTAVETALDDLRDRALLIADEDGDRWLLPTLGARYLRRVRPEAVGEAGGRLADRAYALFTGNLAELALDGEDWPAAESLAREALALSEPLGRKELIAADSQRLAKALARQGRGAEGRSHAERAVAIYTELRSQDLAQAQATLAECQAQP